MNPGYVILAQEVIDQTVLTKYELTTWEKLDEMAFDVNAFALAGMNTAAYLQVGETLPSVSVFSQCDFTQWVCSPVLNITYSSYAAYPGNSGWPASGFAGGMGYVVLQIQQPNDDYVSVVHQVKLGGMSEAPVLVDTVKYDYEYSHNLLATEDWVYTDTDDAVIARVGIQ